EQDALRHLRKLSERMRDRQLAGAAAALVVASLASTSAAAPSARLVYVREAGAEDCPDEEVLRAAVRARLGYDPFFPYAPATLYAEVGRKDDVYRAHVKLVDEKNVVRGARSLEHRGGVCADVIDAMALSMSIAIDPRSLVGPPAPHPPEAAGA